MSTDKRDVESPKAPLYIVLTPGGASNHADIKFPAATADWGTIDNMVITEKWPDDFS